MSKRAKLENAEGTHQEITGRELKQMIWEWNEITMTNDRELLERHGLETGRKLADVLPTLVYARVAQAAFSLRRAADIVNAEFDPVNFGRRCEEIAREELDRYRTAFETEGTA